MIMDYFDHSVIHKSHAISILNSWDFKITTPDGEIISQRGDITDGEQFEVKVVANSNHYFTISGKRNEGEIPPAFPVAHKIFLTDIYAMNGRDEAQILRDSSLVLVQDIKKMLDQLNDGELTFDQLIDQYLYTLRSYLMFARSSIYLCCSENNLSGYKGIIDGEIVKLDSSTTWEMDSSSIIGTAAINQTIFFSNHPLKDD
jgi:hypothetical protein